MIAREQNQTNLAGPWKLSLKVQGNDNSSKNTARLSQSSADKIVLLVDHGQVQLLPVGSQGDEQQDAVLEEEAANLAHPQPLEQPATIQQR
jgi:hypothetical protein